MCKVFFTKAHPEPEFTRFPKKQALTLLAGFSLIPILKNVFFSPWKSDLQVIVAFGCLDSFKSPAAERVRHFSSSSPSRPFLEQR